MIRYRMICALDYNGTSCTSLSCLHRRSRNLRVQGMNMMESLLLLQTFIFFKPATVIQLSFCDNFSCFSYPNFYIFLRFVLALFQDVFAFRCQRFFCAVPTPPVDTGFGSPHALRTNTELAPYTDNSDVFRGSELNCYKLDALKS